MKTQFMTSFNPASVVLVHFSFTDLSSGKKRPAIIINKEEYAKDYNDYILMPLTSVQQRNTYLKINYWQEAGLVKPTWFKPLIVTVSRTLILRTIGTLHNNDQLKVHSIIKAMIAEQFV